MSANDFFGWDLLYRTIHLTVNKKADILVAFAHFLLIKRSNLRCLGTGEDKTISEDEVGSELLPLAWNDDPNKYALRYVYDKELYLLLGHITEGNIIINFMNVKTKKVSNIALDVELVVQKTEGTLEQMIPNASQLADRYDAELVKPVFTGTTKEVTTQTATTSTQDRREPAPDILRIVDPTRGLRPQFPPVGAPPFGFPEVGRGDLDPLGRLGQGNLLPFPNRNPSFDGQPRFDPFGPQGIRRDPNPDHLPPPNFGGFDYYM